MKSPLLYYQMIGRGLRKVKVSKMKITKEHYTGDIQFRTVEQAIQYKLIPNPHGYNGQIERLKVCIELQSEVIAKLVDKLAESILSPDEIKEILGYGYKAER